MRSHVMGISSLSDLISLRDYMSVPSAPQKAVTNIIHDSLSTPLDPAPPVKGVTLPVGPKGTIPAVCVATV